MTDTLAYEGEDDDARVRSEREAFVCASYAGLFRWFVRLAASAELAADLTQETFAAFWASAERRPPAVAPITWLYAIGRNIWRKRLRDQKVYGPEQPEELAAGDRSPEERAVDREFLEAVRCAVSALPHDLREAFTLRFWQEFTYEQVAEVQGVSPGLARWRYFAARQRLHRALASWDPAHVAFPEETHVRRTRPNP